jgi:hypothetical protein
VLTALLVLGYVALGFAGRVPLPWFSR